LLQPRAFGPSSVPSAALVTLLYFVAVAQVLTLPRPVLVPSCVIRPLRIRALTATSKPSHVLSRSSPKYDSRRRIVCVPSALAAAVGTYTTTGYPPPPARRESCGAVSV
jgi:hypothetical protein